MAAIVGFGFLLLIIANCSFIPSLIILANKKNIFSGKSSEIILTVKALTLAGFILALVTELSLIYSYIVSDYSVANVYYNSHHLKPLIYKISGSWGNHEGSMLLLITILSGYSAAFAFFSKTDDKKKMITIAVQSLILLEIAIYTAYASNPFLRIFPVPNVGLGLNPILQDIGLAMHPPMLYLGYIGFSIVFSFTMAGLITGRIDQEFAGEIKNWLFFTWGFLTLGIGLGSWWAYRELGWGGYWFWDPVENVSLMPWLAGAALIHSVTLLERKGTFKLWVSLLGIITFTLCLIGIFLVRSGILTSVHAFAVDVKRGFFIIFLILTISGAGLLTFALNAAKLKSDHQPKIKINSKTGMVLFNNYFLIIALFVVFLGTIYPIFSLIFLDSPISVSASYYNQIFNIIIIPFLALIIFIFTKIKGQMTKQLPLIFAHCGFILIVAGVLTSSYFGLTKETNIKKDQEIVIREYKIKFDSIEYVKGKNYLARQGSFSVFKNNQLINILKPQLRYYPVSDQTTYEAAINHSFFGDLYIVLGNKDDDQFYALRIYYKPMIYLIWLGCLMIFIAAIIKITIGLKYFGSK